MENRQSKKIRINMLEKRSLPDLGFFEKIRLWIRGRFDGAMGLPREASPDIWTSPHIDKEFRSLNELESLQWGRLQIEEQDEYAHLGELMDLVLQTNSQLEEARQELSAAMSQEKSYDTSRKQGEGKLTDAQVAARRAKEREKRLSVLKNRIESLRGKLASEITEFSELRNKIVEDCNSTRAICNRVRDHVWQRLDVYWHAAMRRHPDRVKMPVTPNLEFAPHAEEEYMKPHKALMERAEQLNMSLSHDGRE